jgi:hypothetical protein
VMDEQRFWEPWTPEVGRRVRVRISPECERHAKAFDRWFVPTVQGWFGTVTELPGGRLPNDPRGHVYWVDFGSRRPWGGYFAAVELEPLS